MEADNFPDIERYLNGSAAEMALQVRLASVAVSGDGLVRDRKPDPLASHKLRVGLFSAAGRQPRWMVEALSRVVQSGIAELTVICEGKETTAALPWAWRAYAGIDSRVFARGADPSQLLDMKSHVPHSRFLAYPGRTASSYATEAWRDVVGRLALDVIIATPDVGDDKLDGLSKFGVWRYCFGEKCSLVEAMAGVNETASGAAVTASGLRVHRHGEPVDRLVYRSWSRTFPFSVARNRRNVLRKMTQFAGRALRNLHRSQSDWVEQWARLPEVAQSAEDNLPSRAETAGGLLRIGARIGRRSLQKLLYVDQWFLAYRFGDGEFPQSDAAGQHRLMPPKDRFWADPFALERNGRYYIFFEEFLFSRGKGHIAAIEVDRAGNRSAPVRVLERLHHLSYPFLFESDGELFMIPESGDNRTVELHRCVEFPHRWRLEKVLLRGARFTDATLHRNGDGWWMFVNLGVEGTEAHDELHLYFAENLFADWTAHAGNPVKSDVRSARPAGHLYVRDGALYRPAQICAPLYGSGIVINRVVELSRETYREEEDHRIVPAGASGILGIHTLNRAGDLSVADGFLRRARLGGRSAGTLQSVSGGLASAP